MMLYLNVLKISTFCQIWSKESTYLKSLKLFKSNSIINIVYECLINIIA